MSPRTSDNQCSTGCFENRGHNIWEQINSWASLPNIPFWGASFRETPLASQNPLAEASVSDLSVTVAVQKSPIRFKDLSLTPENNGCLCVRPSASPADLETERALPFSFNSAALTTHGMCSFPGRGFLLGCLKYSFTALFPHLSLRRKKRQKLEAKFCLFSGRGQVGGSVAEPRGPLVETLNSQE